MDAFGNLEQGFLVGHGKRELNLGNKETLIFWSKAKQIWKP
ncbi:hypothetical protein C943_04123 [Mariniradius saccharolyticus AK6]|uniref:Uncharacterized protein n=1 Tax=Mariniradius saccharolyticus AK6 TaxID=1239962 RepID=M7XG37_9BACT|nr:hypothetical protein C943_04123 [Mariniradius saccharolyticus AK6]